DGFSQIRNVCSQKGPVCYECPLSPVERCSTNSIRYCNPGEFCVTHLQKNNDVILVEKKCSSECTSDIKDLRDCLDEFRSCNICCNTDYCDLLPYGDHVTSRSPNIQGFPRC